MAEDLLQPSIHDARGLALAQQIERLTQIDRSKLLVYLIDNVDSSALPHLADQFHVNGLEGWDTVSTDEERRSLIKSSIAYHRLKGTLAGMRWGGKRVGLNIVRAITPPAKTYLAPTLTRQERDEFLARYPQLRLFRFRDRGSQIPNGFYCNAAYLGGATGGIHYPTITDAILRIGWRAFVADKLGNETAVNSLVREITRDKAEAQLQVTIRQPSVAGFALYPDTDWQIPRAFLVSNDAAARLYEVNLTQPYLDFDEDVHQHAAPPKLDPIDIRYTEVAEQWVEHGVMFGRYVSGHLVDNGSRDRLYRRFYLFDPEVEVPRRGRSTHVGTMKLGMPAYTAEIKVSMPAKRSPRVLSRFAAGYWSPTTESRLIRGRQAVALASAMRDRVWVDTHLYKTVKTSSIILSGTHTAGEVISNI